MVSWRFLSLSFAFFLGVLANFFLDRLQAVKVLDHLINMPVLRIVIYGAAGGIMVQRRDPKHRICINDPFLRAAVAVNLFLLVVAMAYRSARLKVVKILDGTAEVLQIRAAILNNFVFESWRFRLVRGNVSPGVFHFWVRF